ncbi:hypothetical protein Pmani_007296 [Petrolisthes manimaculis]|uniref:Uncharacterized protein n=1 Tax=Petrolisthes manimaculis TaxID=1843537 RepID=A0AAE1Q8T0_9EUCA|nr:hypothetical protein Pmani_007296 [Petrolisthes manimaculis]
MYTLLKQRRMRWLGHIVRMNDGQIPKDLLYGELAQGKRPIGRPQLRFKEVCKRDLKAWNIDQNSWEADCAEKSFQVRRNTRSVTRGKENEKKGCNPSRQTSVRLHLRPLPQGLSFPHRTGQPHTTLYQNQHPERNFIVFRD